DYH
ncbi:DNA polymerase III, alpha subunit, partial [Vibrio harveyi]